jgi:hypothetical protein
MVKKLVALASITTGMGTAEGEQAEGSGTLIGHLLPTNYLARGCPLKATWEGSFELETKQRYMPQLWS